MDCNQILGCKELIFVQMEALGTEIDQILGSRNCIFPQFWDCKMLIFQKKKNCYLRWKYGLKELKSSKMGVLWSSQEAVKRESNCRTYL